MKLLTAAIPCYNSAAYMRKAIESILVGGEDVEIIIVNDGSKDETAEIASEYEKRYPTIVKAVNQENGGHGSAVNAGLKNATGMYYKVVDSDDWLDEEALLKVLKVLKEMVAEGRYVDMFIANYVYEKVHENKQKVINYTTALPQHKVFTWNEVGQFQQGKYMLMHSVIYRTELLRECNLELPKHTFYVDNIFVYQPLRYVNTMYYMNVDLYRYFIGRDDQSVTEANMMKRIDQQLRVNKIMIDSADVMSIENKNLQRYMIKYLGIIMTVSSVYLIKEGSEESLQKRDDLWKYLEDKDSELSKKVSAGVLGTTMKFKSKAGHSIVKMGYSISKKIFKFG
jgi:glycosyltransferase involved in cell wall biosynthesis